MSSAVTSSESLGAGVKPYFYWLDWLRFLAALMVVVAHVRGGNWVEWGRLDEMYRTKATLAFFVATRPGVEWVTVFFVMSGFLVGGKVLERVARGTFDVRSYAIDRFARIYLPFVPALLLTAAIVFLLGSPVSFWKFFGNLLGLQGVLCEGIVENAPLWSLTYEIWFYLLAGLAAIAMNSQTRGKFWVYCGIMLSLGVFTRLNATFLFCWVLGAISYRLMRKRVSWKIALAGCVLALAGCVLSQLKSETVSLDVKAFRQFLPSRNIATLVLSLGLVFVLPFLSQLRPASSRAAAFERGGGRLAAFSYTLYLTHYPLIKLWGRFFERSQVLGSISVMWFLVKIAACLLIAWLLYLPFEAQTALARNWLRRLLGPRNATAA